MRCNNQECLISEGKISQKIAYNGILGLRDIDVHVPRIERYSENSDDVNWSLIFSMVFKVCLEVKFIEFQYCFLHDILINNFWLNTWKLGEDWLCTFSNEKFEDLCHLFWGCRFTQLFWTDFSRDILHGKQVTKNDIFFGKENMKESFRIFSAKKCIYISRFAETIPLFHEFKMYLDNLKKNRIYYY